MVAGLCQKVDGILFDNSSFIPAKRMTNGHHKSAGLIII